MFIVLYYDTLHFCGISCNVSSFISDFCYLSLYFLLSLAKYGTVDFVDLIKKPTLSFIAFFFIVFLLSISFIWAVIFIPPFPLLTLGLACSSFSSPFKYKVRLLIGDFLNMDVYCYKLSSYYCFCCILCVVLCCVFIFIFQYIF